MDLTKEDMDKRSSLPYPMELGSPAFTPIDIVKEKDVLYNAGKLNAQQEYDRIMEQVNVLKKQAESLHRRMQVSDVMHNVTYGIKVVHGKIYYVYLDVVKDVRWLSPVHPHQWSALGKQNEFLMAVRLMGDSTWQEVPLE